MISTMLPQTVRKPSGVDVPAYRGASVVVGFRDVVAFDRGFDAFGAGVSTNAARAPWDTYAWSPPTR